MNKETCWFAGSLEDSRKRGGRDAGKRLGLIPIPARLRCPDWPGCRAEGWISWWEAPPPTGFQARRYRRLDLWTNQIQVLWVRRQYSMKLPLVLSKKINLPFTRITVCEIYLGKSQGKQHDVTTSPQVQHITGKMYTAENRTYCVYWEVSGRRDIIILSKRLLKILSFCISFNCPYISTTINTHYINRGDISSFMRSLGNLSKLLSDFFPLRGGGGTPPFR